MLASIRHRLDEIESVSGIPPLFLYVQCGLAEAFALGQRMAYMWGFHQLSSTDQEPSAWTLPPIDWHIRVMSRHSPKKPYHLDLAEAMKAPGVGKDLVDSDSGNSSAWTGARTNLDYRFSCGYGINSREAFVALRAAKASGKNITIGSI